MSKLRPLNHNSKYGAKYLLESNVSVVLSFMKIFFNQMCSIVDLSLKDGMFAI